MENIPENGVMMSVGDMSYWIIRHRDADTVRRAVLAFSPAGGLTWQVYQDGYYYGVFGEDEVSIDSAMERIRHIWGVWLGKIGRSRTDLAHLEVGL